MPDRSSLPRPLMLAIAVAQGLLLFALYRAFDADAWPSDSPLWYFPLLTLTIALPVLLLLSLETGIEARVGALVAVFGVALALVAVYVGFQATPYDEFPVGGIGMVFGLSIAIACFKALMYLQQRAAGQPMSYEVLFTYSWRNFLVLLLTGVFVGAFWGVLQLWASLFKAIDIDVFRKLFGKDWFLFPVLGFAHGLGVIIFRNLTGVIDSITRLLQGLIKLLLPLILFVAVAFLVTLPFVGLDALWSTGWGTGLLLWLLALALFFVNAVYQDGRHDEPYPPLIHRFIYMALLSLPVVSGLSFYGLMLRVDQYGWSVSRCWALLVWALLSLFALGYVIGILRRGSGWTRNLARVNTAMGLVVLALMLLVNSPVLDFRKIAVSSQLARVANGEIEMAKMDFWYLRNGLARPGYLAVERIRAEHADDAELIALIDNPMRPHEARQIDSDAVWAMVVKRPTDLEVPPGVKRQIMQMRFMQARISKLVLVETDLDDDGQPEYAAIVVYENSWDDAPVGYIGGSMYFYLTDDGWQQGQLVQVDGGASGRRLESLVEGDIEVTEPRYKNLRIGGVELRPM